MSVIYWKGISILWAVPQKYIAPLITPPYVRNDGVNLQLLVIVQPSHNSEVALAADQGNPYSGSGAFANDDNRQNN